MGDYLVTVCAVCLRASCWHGEQLCGRSRDAGTRELRASQLDKLGVESADHYSRERITKVCGEVHEITRVTP